MPCSTMPLDDGSVRVIIDRPEIKAELLFSVGGELLESQVQIVSRGLGDTIAKAASKLGVKPCGGCKKRQNKLNKMLPYKA